MEIENLLRRLDISLRNDWGITLNERQRMRALLWESRDAIKQLKEEKSNEYESVPEVPVRTNGSDGDHG